MKQYAILASLFLTILTGHFSLHAQNNAEANIRKAYASLEKSDFNTFAGLCADDFVDYASGPMPVKGVWNAIEQYKMFLGAFPDMKFKVGSVAPAGKNRYFVEVTSTGTNSAPFMGLPPTGKSFMVRDMDIIELNAEGKCTSHWSANPNEPLRQIGYGSLANPSTDVVLNGAYANFGKGDVAAILAGCTDDVVFDIHDRMFDSKERIFKGKAEVGKFFQELGSKFQYTKFQPVRFVADGEDVFILIDAEYKYIPTGKMYASTYTHHFKVQDGKVSYFRGIDDFQQMK